MLQPKPSFTTFTSLHNDIKNGIYKIPQFQREFVWERARSAKLLDSILKGYPLGTFILWKTKERLRSVRNIGGMVLPDVPSGDYAMQVLDGQQRMTSLFAALEGLIIHGKENFGEICVDLDIDPTGDDPIVYSSGAHIIDTHARIFFKELRETSFTQLMKRYNESQLERIELYKRQIETYQFPTVEITDAPLAVATEIFTRLNVGGKSLSVYEIMVAKTWDDSKGFDLNEKVAVLNRELNQSGYGGIDPTILMQNVVALAKDSIKAKDILSIDKSTYIETWPHAARAIKQAVDFCRSDLRIPVRALLPYQRQLVPLSYFFHLHPHNPTGQMKRCLVDLFFRIGLSERYSSSAESSVAQDLKAVKLIVEKKQPVYDYGVNYSSDFIERNGSFRTGKAFIKSLLCILAAHQPRNFNTGGSVILDNALLKQKNSRNYHHFFPLSILKRDNPSGFQPNHIANITLVGADLNKNKIRAKKPSVYLTEFSQSHAGWVSDLATHLIDVEAMNVLNDDYEKFFKIRCNKLSDALKELLIPQSMDSLAPQILPEEYDSEPEQELLEDESADESNND